MVSLYQFTLKSVTLRLRKGVTQKIEFTKIITLRHAVLAIRGQICGARQYYFYFIVI